MKLIKIYEYKEILLSLKYQEKKTCLLVGNSFQWPPPRTQEEQGPTAAPIYINPNSRTSSPAPRNLSSPAPAITPLAMRSTSSPARSTLASPTPVTHSGINNGSQFTSPTPGLTTPSRSSIGSPSPAIQSPIPILKNQTQLPANVSNTPNRNQHVQFSSQQNGQKDWNRKDWSKTLNENSAGASDNATDFTKNFLNQLGNPNPVSINQNGSRNNNLHNPTPMEPSSPFAGINPEPPTQDAPVVGPGQNVSAPRRGRGVLQQQKPGMRTPMCGNCNQQIR